MGEDFGNEVDQVLNLYGDHVRIFSPDPCIGAGRIVSGGTCSRAGFHDQLGRPL